MNPTKPESNGPFLIYEVPNFQGAEADTEHKGFYMLLPIEHCFPDMDEEVNWCSGHVAGSTHILFRIPAWPHALYPKALNSEILYKSILEQVPEPVQKSMNASHTVFDSEDADTAATESRKWKYVLLDFSKVKDLGELSSKVLYQDAGERESLDYDLIDVPLYADGSGNVTHMQSFLGFKVGCVDARSSRKVARSGARKSKLQQKREAAVAARQKQMQQG